MNAVDDSRPHSFLLQLVGRLLHSGGVAGDLLSTIPLCNTIKTFEKKIVPVLICSFGHSYKRFSLSLKLLYVERTKRSLPK